MLHVYHYLEKHGFPPLGTSTQAIFAAVEQACGVVPYQELLTRSVQLNDSILDDLTSDIASRPNSNNFEIGVLQAYGVLHDCHKYMVHHFLNDPDGYAKPVDYLDRTLGIWPEPPVRWSFGRPFRRLKRTDLSKYARVVLFDEIAGPDEVFLRQGITGGDLSTPMMTIDLQIADNWQYSCAMADCLFAEFHRDQPDIEFQRGEMKKRGIYLMEILG